MTLIDNQMLWHQFEKSIRSLANALLNCTCSWANMGSNQPNAHV